MPPPMRFFDFSHSYLLSRIVISFFRIGTYKSNLNCSNFQSNGQTEVLSQVSVSDARHPGLPQALPQECRKDS